MDIQTESLSRALLLLELAANTGAPMDVEIYRSVVVLTHAYLEDVLRSLARAFLAEADEQTLNEVPLVGINEANRRENFGLGKLLPHKAKTVADLISESIAQYLERRTFNNITDIARLLLSIGFKISNYERFFPVLDAMMRRRHQIVHRGDRVGTTAQAITRFEADPWLLTVNEFTEQLMKDVLARAQSTRTDSSAK